jgi:septal ring factor EnvC (AmiA/AmiB activator)
MRSLRLQNSGFVVAGVTVLVASLSGVGVVSADPIDDQEAKVEQYADMLEALEEETARLAEEYDIAVDELRQLEEDVATAEEAVAEKEAEVAALQAELGDVAVQAYVDSGTSGMGIFSEPAQFSKDLQRDELTRVALNSGTADSDDLS